MADVTILHNTRCSTSRHALAAADEAGTDIEVVEYLKHPLTADQLRALLAKLEDEPSALVRRDPAFKEAGLTDADVASADQVVAVLTAYPRLMQRPVLVRGDRAIIGRPKERVSRFLSEDPTG